MSMLTKVKDATIGSAMNHEERLSQKYFFTAEARSRSDVNIIRFFVFVSVFAPPRYFSEELCKIIFRRPMNNRKDAESQRCKHLLNCLFFSAPLRLSGNFSKSYAKSFSSALGP
jgi:hypothetical protein